MARGVSRLGRTVASLLVLGVCAGCAEPVAPISDEAAAPDLHRLWIRFASQLEYAVVVAEPVDPRTGIPEQSFVSARIETAAGDVELLRLTRVSGFDERLNRLMRIEIDRAANAAVVEQQLRSVGIVRDGGVFLVVDDPFRAWAVAPRVPGVLRVEPVTPFRSIPSWANTGLQDAVLVSQRSGRVFDGVLNVSPGEEVTVRYESTDGREYQGRATVPHPN